MPAAHRSKPRRWRRRLLTLAVASVAACAAGEVVVRAAVGAPIAEREPLMKIVANPHRGWAMVPGVHYTYHHPVHINSLGLRGAEIAPKQPGELRVLTLGDSLVYGQGVADDQTVPHHMERLLRGAVADRWPVTVINGGHRAYGINQELGLLEELGPELKPDVVVVFWYWNDIVEVDIKARYERLRQTGPIVFDVGAPMQGSTRRAWHAKQLLRQSALIMFLYDQWRAATEPAEEWATNVVGTAMRTHEVHVARLRELAGTMGFQLYFAAIPDASSLAGPHFSTDIVDQLDEVLRRHQVPHIDLQPALVELYRDLGNRLPVIPYDFHYDGAGNTVIAQTVVEHLVGDGLARKPRR